MIRAGESNSRRMREEQYAVKFLRIEKWNLEKSYADVLNIFNFIISVACAA